ncbi:serine protease [Candidatus Gracilibacteria bacterium]|nr:serine protease [Candidatus Gracilibacteria bacterium]
MIEKDSKFSRWVVENTSLNNFLRLSENLDDQVDDELNNRIANELLGLNPEGNSTSFDFSDAGQPLTVVEVVEEILPSVISISVSTPNSGFQTSSSGTGFFVSKEGLIITNKHVIAPKCSEIKNSQVKITALDNKQIAYDLELLTVDPIEDLAILKVIGGEENFEPVQLFDSSKLKLGTGVIAVGNVLGELQNTVTKGIVSGLDRTLNTRVQDECTGLSFAPESLIQTDAAINRGNSGGPLFESSGLLVGMNTYGAPDAQNIGLAIPASRIKSALDSYKLNNKIIRPRIGIFPDL